MAEADPEKDVDWDQAWQTELQRRETGKATWRPEGREAVTDEQLRQARIANAVSDASTRVQGMAKTWQFWVAVLGLISIFAAVVGNTGEQPANNFV